MAVYTDDLALIVRYDGTKEAFDAVKSSYLGKVVFIYGSETEVANQAGLVQAIWVSDANGGRYLDMANVEYISNNLTRISGITVDGTTYYPSSGGGAITLAGAYGIAVTVDTTTGAVTFDGKVLSDAVASAQSTASAAATAAATNLASINGLRTRVDGIETTANNAATKTELQEAVDDLIGEYNDATDDNSISLRGLKTYIDNETEKLAVAVVKDGDEYKIYQDNGMHSSATLVGTINVPKDMVVESGEILDVNGVKTLRLQLANTDSYVDIAVSDLVDAYTTAQNATEVQLAISENNVISATIKEISGAKITNQTITLSKLTSGVQTSLGKADSAIQDVFSGNGTIASNYIKVTDDQNDAKKKGIDANIKRMSEVTGVGQELDGLVSALDIYAYMKARFSVKVVS